MICMKNILQVKLLCLCTVIAVSVSAKAAEYQSMIRYDRVWEHISINWNDRQVYYVKFDGAEEINGKTYHRLVSFKKASYDYDSASQPYLFDIVNDYYAHEGYLREEDGKVYTLLRNVRNSDEYNFEELYIPGGNIEHPADLEEKLLYDFTCKEGETYTGLHIDREAAEMNYIVKSIESIKIDGEDYRIQRICPDWIDYNGEPVIEGIGIGSYGCLTTINFLNVPTCPCMNHIFNRVLSSDGKVIYSNEYDAVDLPYGDVLGIDTIEQNQIDNDTPMYDMIGRRITNPVAGQLYIKGGKKFVGK